jgi:hypothetical protein
MNGAVSCSGREQRCFYRQYLYNSGKIFCSTLVLLQTFRSFSHKKSVLLCTLSSLFLRNVGNSYQADTKPHNKYRPPYWLTNYRSKFTSSCCRDEGPDLLSCYKDKSVSREFFWLHKLGDLTPTPTDAPTYQLPSHHCI